MSSERELLRDAVSNLYDKESTPQRVREAEALGFDAQLWDALSAFGITTMGVAEALGGGGATLGDLAAVAAVHGAHLGSVPLVEAVVAARLLATVGAEAPVGLTVLAPRPAEGRTVSLVPGAATADHVVVLDADRLVVVPGHGVRRRTTELGAAADVHVIGEQVLLSGPDAVAAFAHALDEWRVLTAGACAGLASAVLDIGVAYAKDRHQFGVPIGSFQSLQHRLADRATEVDGAHLLADEAAAYLDDRDPLASAAAAEAYWYCSRVAERVAAWALHVHGGYGFMLEYDVQLYLRRAKASALALGASHVGLEAVAQRLWRDGPQRRLLDFALAPEVEEFRAEVRAFIAEHLDDEIVDDAHVTGTRHHWGFHRAMCERGYLAAGWPTEVGGLGRTPVETAALMQEMYYAGAPVDGAANCSMVGATLVLCGTDAQRTEIVPRILAGELLCCLGYSEPDAGSDVAAASTRAVRDGDEWVVNGQKMFTTLAHEADLVFLLCRTNSDVPKHRGLTMFLVPMSSPGIEIQGVETLGGERTNITFYQDVRVPDSCRVGAVDDGWSVMHAALVYERGTSNWGEPAALVDRFAAWAIGATRDGRVSMDDPVVRSLLARHHVTMHVGRLLMFRVAELAAAGGLPLVEGSMAKLWSSEAFVAAADDLSDLLGPFGSLREGEAGAPLAGLVEHAYRHAQVTTIYGGSSEVQRGIIAEHGLGLPRTR